MSYTESDIVKNGRAGNTERKFLKVTLTCELLLKAGQKS